jgi:acylphosphatase
MIKHLNIKVSGMVQGVFFRASTQKKAEELGIKGFVKNERDGSVYIEAEADEDTLKNFAKWCEQGPPSARVDQCEATEGVIQHFESFMIKR